jgi:hypothetical protein
LKEPQSLEPQVAVQTTPASAGSLLTWVNKESIVLTTRDAGTAAPKPPTMDVGGAMLIGVAPIVRLTLLLCDGLPVTVAVMVTVPPIGATDGGA